MKLRDLPADTTHLREAELEAHTAWQGHFLNIRRDLIALPNGKHTQREYIVHSGAVMIVPWLDDGDVIVERQWRYPMYRAMLEFPAGKLDAGEHPFRCAERELTEETGYTAAEWARAGILHNAIAYSTEGIEIWFARGLTPGERHLDEGEFLDVAEASVEELEEAAQRGELTDAKSLIALLWIHHSRAGRWPLQWRSSAEWRDEVLTDAHPSDPPGSR